MKQEVPTVLFRIPCHIASERRILTSLCCAVSVAEHFNQEFNVYVSVSGPSDF